MVQYFEPELGVRLTFRYIYVFVSNINYESIVAYSKRVIDACSESFHPIKAPSVLFLAMFGLQKLRRPMCLDFLTSYSHVMWAVFIN